jgi:hypothetical protein
MKKAKWQGHSVQGVTNGKMLATITIAERTLDAFGS